MKQGSVFTESKTSSIRENKFTLDYAPELYLASLRFIFTYLQFFIKYKRVSGVSSRFSPYSFEKCAVKIK